MARINRITIIAGGRGCGKTTFIQGNPELKIKGIMPLYKDHVSIKKTLIIDTFDSPVWRKYPAITIDDIPRWKKGTYRIFSSDTDAIMSMIEKHLFSTCIIMEDASKFIDTKLSKDEKRIVVDTKQKNCDMYFIFHALALVPNDLIRLSDFLVIFKTNEAFTRNLKDKFAGRDDIEKAFLQVKESNNPHISKTIYIGS